MNELQESLPFSKNDVDKSNYTASLLTLCSIHNIINQDILLRIRDDLDNAFVEVAEQFTNRESSTIPIKRAELLYLSLLFQCDVALLHLKSISQAVFALENTQISVILEQGKNIILAINEDCKKIFQTAYKNRLSFPIFTYQYVMNKAFDEYCAGYSARFDAKNIIASIDYPLLGKPAYGLKSQGALFIHEYYTSVMYENIFCKCFDEKDIESLLISYGKQNHSHYTDMIFNISEIVLCNLIANLLLSENRFNLSLSNKDIQLLEEKFGCLNQEDFYKSVSKAFLNLDKFICDHKCCLYLKTFTNTFSMEMYERLKINSLVNYLVVCN